MAHDTPPIFVITGQLAAGKSTVAVALMGRFPHGVHLDVDGIREMVVSGHAGPLEWTDETERQFRLAVTAAAHIAAVYHRAGFAVAIEGAIDPADAEEALAAVGTLESMVGVVLHPAMEVAQARNRTRTHKGFDTSILAEVIVSIDRDLAASEIGPGWIRIDNSGDTVRETVDRIMALAGT